MSYLRTRVNHNRSGIRTIKLNRHFRHYIKTGASRGQAASESLCHITLIFHRASANITFYSLSSQKLKEKWPIGRERENF